MRDLEMQKPIVILDDMGRLSSITYPCETMVTCYHYDCDGERLADGGGEEEGGSQDAVAEDG